MFSDPLEKLQRGCSLMGHPAPGPSPDCGVKPAGSIFTWFQRGGQDGVSHAADEFVLLVRGFGSCLCGSPPWASCTFWFPTPSRPQKPANGAVLLTECKCVCLTHSEAKQAEMSAFGAEKGPRRQEVPVPNPPHSSEGFSKAVFKVLWIFRVAGRAWLFVASFTVQESFVLAAVHTGQATILL